MNSRTPTTGRLSSAGRDSKSRDGRAWVAFEDSRESVPFDVREGLDSIGVDADALDAGLVVVPRESVGIAGDLAGSDRSPATLAPTTPVRALIEQVSSVEHAVVLGVPMSSEGDGDRPRLTAGLGRPLILTTLEPAEAMRILAGGSTRPRLVAACFIVGTALLAAGIAWAGLGAVMSAIVPVALAASPTPAQGGDPRSSGEGPGLVGQPGVAILAVIGIAVLAIVVTKIYVRLTNPNRASAAGAASHRFWPGAMSPSLRRSRRMTFVLLARTVRLVGCRPTT